MKKLITMATASIFAMAAYAETAIVTSVEPNTRDVFRTVPETECAEVEVPIYEEINKSTAESIAGGAALGGLLGGIATDSRQGVGMGALFGGLIGASNTERVLVGYKKVETCDTTHHLRNITIIDDYTVHFEWNGITGTTITENVYSPGDQVEIDVVLILVD